MQGNVTLITYRCLQCGKEFTCDSPCDFCSFECYKKSRLQVSEDQQYTGTEIADIIAATEKVLDKHKE